MTKRGRLDGGGGKKRHFVIAVWREEMRRRAPQKRDQRVAVS